jgi:hypothetical protein
MLHTGAAVPQVGELVGWPVVADVHVFWQDLFMTLFTRVSLYRAVMRPCASAVLALCCVPVVVGVARAQSAPPDKPVYKCPGNLYTDALSAREAQDKGCKTLDGAPVTVIQSNVPRGSGSAGGGASSRPAGAGERVGADDQKARDADARLILEAELKKEEEALASLQKEYNSGQPERRGDERNFQKYQDRINELKAAITRKESDIASLRRELSKLGGGK